MAICFNCEKGSMKGMSHTHHRGVAGGRWKKRAPHTAKLFKPNLQKITILEEGKEKKINICSKCLKRIKKDIKDGVKPSLQVKKIAVKK